MPSKCAQPEGATRRGLFQLLCAAPVAVVAPAKHLNEPCKSQDFRVRMRVYNLALRHGELTLNEAVEIEKQFARGAQS